MGIIAHVDAGKTTTTEQMLYASGAVRRPGRVDSGSTVTDFMPQERERGITIQSAAVHFDWEGHSICLIDTPGHVDFGHEVERALRVLDGVVLVVDAVAGAQAQTEAVARRAWRRKLPAMAVVNKMDRPGADFNKAIASLGKRLPFYPKFIPLHKPVFNADEFNGFEERIFTDFDALVEELADLDDELASLYLSEEAVSTEDLRAAIRRATLAQTCVPVLCASMLKGLGVESLLDGVIDFLPSPREALTAPVEKQEMRALAFKVTQDKQRGPLVYARVYEGEWKSKEPVSTIVLDGEVLKRHPERATQLLKPFADSLEPQESFAAGEILVAVGLRAAVTGSTIIPGGKGNKVALNPLEGIAAPPTVFSLALEPMISSQHDDLETALSVLCRDDPSLKYVLDEDSGRVVLSGMGELHLEIAVDRLKREYNVEVLTGAASVSYRESIEEDEGTGTVVYDRTMGTKRLYAGLTVTVRRTSSTYGTDPPNVNVSVTGDTLLIEALRDGLKAAATRGPLMGRPLAGLDIECSSIQIDADTTPGAVRACAALALAEALKDATAVLLEPIMRLELALVPSSRLGDVLTDLAVARRATVGDVAAQEGDRNTVKAHAPLANLIGYSTAIRSITAGDADFSVEYSHLAACPTPDLSSR